MTRDYPDMWVLRHGQTEWNAAERMQGMLDSPLTDLGRQQARDQNRILRQCGLPPDTRFAASPLGRTRATAEIALNGLGGALDLDDRLKEISVGAFEGKTEAELKDGWPEIMYAEDDYSWHYRAPDGERFDGFQDRIRGWLTEQTSPCVVITHGMVSGVLRGLLLALDLDGLRQLPGGQGIVYHIRDGQQTRLSLDGSNALERTRI